MYLLCDLYVYTEYDPFQKGHFYFTGEQTRAQGG